MASLAVASTRPNGGNGNAVRNGAVAGRVLDRVREGMPEVERLAHSTFVFVLRDDPSLHTLTQAFDHLW